MALDPLSGNTTDAFVLGLNSDLVCFNIRFDRFTNFIGLIELPATSGRVEQLIEAIRKNLNSKMFKAAQIHRRLDRRRIRLFEQAGDRASAAYAEVIQNADKTVHRDDLLQQAREAYNQVFNPRKEQIQTRCRNVGRVSSNGFQGSYTEAVAGFLYRHLPFDAVTH